MEINHEVRPYVNLPPVAKARSSSHLAPIIPAHHRSASDDATASSSQDSGVRLRSASTHILSNTGDERLYEECVVIYEYTACEVDEINLPLGQTIRLISKETDNPGWWLGEVNGRTGLFPENYVRLVENIPEYARNHIILPSMAKGDIERLRIGDGVTASVYKIELNIDRVDDNQRKELRMAALKKFKPGYFGQPRHPNERVPTPFEQLRRESTLMYKLNHKNIVRLYGICLDQEYFGLLLELCSGNSLRDLLNKMGTEKTIPFGVMVDWAKQIASGMKYLVDLQYVHRDLKADNILIREEICMCNDQLDNLEFCTHCGRRPINQLTLKITDFGVMKKHSVGAERQSSVGTYAWLAPEAVRDHDYTEASDIWSFGVTLWEILSRDLPYRGMFAFTVAYHVVNKGQTLDIAEDCPEKWKSIMEKCWNIDPNKRPKFAYLEQYFEKISRELDDHEVSGILNNQIKRVQSVMKRDLDVIYRRLDNDNEKATKLTEKLYSSVILSNTRATGPKTKDRKYHGKAQKRVGIQDISGPVGDVKHLMSIQRDTGSDKNLKFYYAEENAGGTLPRLSIAKQSNLSSSTPELNMICRQKAVRYKNRGTHATESPVLNDENEFAKIETADYHDANTTLSHKKGGFFNKFKLSNRHRSTDEEKDRAGSVASRDRRKSSNSFITSIWGKSRESKDADDITYLKYAENADRKEAREKRKEEERMRQLKILRTNDTRIYVKEEDLTARPHRLPTNRFDNSNYNVPRRSPLDQNIPVNHDNMDEIYMAVTPSSRSLSKSSTLDSRQNSIDPSYEIMKNEPKVSSSVGDPSYELISREGTKPTMNWRQIPSTSNESHHNLSSLIPKVDENSIDEPTHYNMSNGKIMGTSTDGKRMYHPIGGGIDYYIPVTSDDNKATQNEENARSVTTSVVNTAYYQCPPRPNAKPQHEDCPPGDTMSNNSISNLGSYDFNLTSITEEYFIKSTQPINVFVVHTEPPKERNPTPEEMYRGLMQTGDPRTHSTTRLNSSRSSDQSVYLSPNSQISPTQSPIQRSIDFGSNESIVRYFPTRRQQQTSQIARSFKIPQIIIESIEEESPTFGPGTRLELARRSCGDLPLRLNSRTSRSNIQTFGNYRFNVFNHMIRYGFFASSDTLSKPVGKRSVSRIQRISEVLKRNAKKLEEEKKANLKRDGEDSETSSNSTTDLASERCKRRNLKSEEKKDEGSSRNSIEPTNSTSSVCNDDGLFSSASGACEFESDNIESNTEKMSTPKKRLRRRTTSISVSRRVSESGSDMSEEGTPRKGILKDSSPVVPLIKTSALEEICAVIAEEEEVLPTPPTVRFHPSIPKMDLNLSSEDDQEEIEEENEEEANDEDGDVTIRDVEISFVNENGFGRGKEGSSKQIGIGMLDMENSSPTLAQDEFTTTRKTLKRRFSDAATRTFRQIRRSFSIVRKSSDESARKPKRRTPVPITRSPSPSSSGCTSNFTTTFTQTDITSFSRLQLGFTSVLSADFKGEDLDITPRASGSRNNELAEFVGDEEELECIEYEDDTNYDETPRPSDFEKY